MNSEQVKDNEIFDVAALDIANVFVRNQTENAEATAIFVGDIKIIEIGRILYSGYGLQSFSRASECDTLKKINRKNIYTRTD